MMRTPIRSILLSLACLAVLFAANQASAIYDPGLGRFMQRDTGGASHMRPGAGYQDGMNQYAAHHVQQGGLDPSGNVVIFVHGINNRNVDDIKHVYAQLKQTWGKDKDQALIHFRYTRFGKNPDFLDAAGGLIGPADYSGNLNRMAGQDLADLISHLKDERKKIVEKHGQACWEPINIVAYSNGSNVAYHALVTFGERVDNLVLLGASLDDRKSYSNNLANKTEAFHNYWSKTDEPTKMVDGIGSDGLHKDVSSRADVHDHHIANVQHSTGKNGVRAINSLRNDHDTQWGPIKNRTAWLTRYMAKQHYAGTLQHNGFPGLSTHGTLPQGTKLQPSRAFHYSVDMRRSTIGWQYGGVEMHDPVEGTYTGKFW